MDLPGPLLAAPRTLFALRWGIHGIPVDFLHVVIADHRELMTALGAACIDDFTPAFGLHTLQKSVHTHATTLSGLIGSLC
jgi:hypothetical protein